MKKIRTVVIGLGRIGMQYGFDSKRIQPASHVSAILENPNFELIGVCEINKKLQQKFRTKFRNKTRIFTNHLKLIQFLKKNEVECDLFVIATPASSHAKIINDILKNYKKSDPLLPLELPLS